MSVITASEARAALERLAAEGKIPASLVEKVRSADLEMFREGLRHSVRSMWPLLREWRDQQRRLRPRGEAGGESRISMSD